MMSQSMKYTNEERKNGEGCDVWIVVDRMKIGGHKAVLSKKSLYFRNMFNTDMMEANMDEITISGYDYETMDMVIGDMYGDKIEITTENGQSIILLANYMQLSDLVDRCAQFIIRQIDQTNCLSMKMLLKSTNCDNKLISITDDYMNAYFVPLSKHESFIELDIEDVTELLSSDKLYVESEIDVCQGGITWLSEKKERWNTEYCERIFKCIRLSLLPSEYLSTKLATYPLFQNDPICTRMIEEAVIRRNVNQQIPRECRTFPSFLVKYSTLRAANEMDTSFYVYDTTTNKWKMWIDIDLGSSATLVGHKQNMYVITITSDQSPLFGKVNCVTGAITSLPPYPGASNNPLAVTIGNKLYASDCSFQRFGFPTHMEVFDIETNKWTRGANTNGRLRGGSSIVAIGKYIYVCGGELFCEDPFLNVERLDTETMEWEDVAPMKYAKLSCSAVCYRGKLYVAGENYDERWIFEVHDPITDQWNELTSPNRCYDYGVLLATFDGLYLLGRKGQRIEHYNVDEDEWKEISSNTPSSEYQSNSFCAFKIEPHRL